jgi:hypothetical protein
VGGLLRCYRQMNIITRDLPHLGEDAPKAALLQLGNGNGSEDTWFWHVQFPSSTVKDEARRVPKKYGRKRRRDGMVWNVFGLLAHEFEMPPAN